MPESSHAADLMRIVSWMRQLCSSDLLAIVMAADRGKGVAR